MKMDKKAEAMRIHESGFNCCQSVIGVFSEEFGLDLGTAYRVSAGFGGGMRRGEVCGAVTGALMVLGLKHGHFIAGDAERKSHIAELTKEFHNRFEAMNGSIICKELLGYNSSIEEERAIIEEKGLFKTVCPKAIEDAISILEEMLAD